MKHNNLTGNGGKSMGDWKVFLWLGSFTKAKSVSWDKSRNLSLKKLASFSIYKASCFIKTECSIKI